jgi:mono/diheme cytochrome c family protein
MRIVASILVILVLGLVQACGGESSVKESSDITTTFTQSGDGKSLFESKCVVCHGSDGAAGIGGAANLATSTLLEAASEAVVANGRGAMRAYKEEMSAEEIKLVNAYILTLRK